MQNTYREIYLGVYALTSRRGKASKSNKVLFASLVKLFVAEHARSNVVVFPSNGTRFQMLLVVEAQYLNKFSRVCMSVNDINIV